MFIAASNPPIASDHIGVSVSRADCGVARVASIATLYFNLADSVDHPGLFRLAHLIIKGESNEAIAQFFSDRAVTACATVTPAHVGSVQRHVVENAENLTLFQMRDEPTPLFERRQQQVKHVVGLIAVRRDDRRANAVEPRPLTQFAIIAFPNSLSGLLDLFACLELSKKECGKHVGRKIARSHINPGVFVHLAPQKAGAIGAFLPYDLGALDIATVVDEQRAAFATGKVLRLVEALRR